MIQDGLTNEGLAAAFKAQDAQLKECTLRVQKAIEDWEAKQPKQPLQSAPQKAKPKYYISQCQLWEHIFGMCQL